MCTLLGLNLPVHEIVLQYMTTHWYYKILATRKDTHSSKTNNEIYSALLYLHTYT